MAKKRKRDARRTGNTSSGASSENNSASGKNRFILEKLLGSGGICEVYSAIDLGRVEWGDANPRVAVKRLQLKLADNPQAKRALAQEYCVLRHLAHTGVVRVFDLHKEPFGVCFSMELLEGQTAHEMLGSRPDGFGDAVAPLGFALFDALKFLHGNGVVHGDIKPSNVFLAPEGRMVLLDFNVATVTPRLGAACSHVTQGLRESLRLPSYSLRYASPERLRGGTPSMADDVYAACCAFYEITSGLHPFGRHSALEAMESKAPLRRPSGLTLIQWILLRRGLSFEPNTRPRSEVLCEVFTPKGLLPTLADIFKIFTLFNHGERNAAA